MITISPTLAPLPWPVQLHDALAQALLTHSDLETRIYLGECGLRLQFAEAERRVRVLREQIVNEVGR